MIPIDSLKDEVRPLYEERDPAHRFDHVERIVAFCRLVGEDLGADMDVLLRAAIIHGVGDKERFREALGEDHDKIIRIAEMNSDIPKPLEEQIIWDGNIIDSLGIIGIARAFTRGGHEGQGLDETIKVIRENMLRPVYTEVGREISIRLLVETNELLTKLERELKTTRE
jgi:uncharacterized protein